MKTVKSALMTSEVKSPKKPVESILRLGPKSVIDLEAHDPEAAKALKEAGLPLTKGAYFFLMFKDSDYQPTPEEYELLPHALVFPEA